MTAMNILIAGFGGQGILFAGKVIAYTGLLDGHEVSWLPSYGPEMRGGTANCSICLSEQSIGSPLVTAPNILIAMNGPSYEKYLPDVEEGGMVLADSSLVNTSHATPPNNVKVFEVPASQLAADYQFDGLANMILIGKFLAETKFSSLEQVYNGLAKCVPARKVDLLESNRKAILLGTSQ